MYCVKTLAKPAQMSQILDIVAYRLSEGSNFSGMRTCGGLERVVFEQCN